MFGAGGSDMGTAKLAGDRHAAVWLFGNVAAFMAAGCGSPPPIDFDALGLVPAQEKLAELSLGKYSVPIPITDGEEGGRARRRNRFQFDFELYALVAPNQTAQIEDAWHRHEGQLRDRVMRVCRSVSIDDLAEPELATLRARLTDAVQAQLGENEIRQILITDVVSQEI
jgi:Flagellar basal body-associated protein FliL